MAYTGIKGVGGSQGLGMGAQGGLPDIDPTQINALLQQFGGMSIPDHTSPQGPFENGWLGRHTGRLGSGLDNALIALANMGPTSMSAGDNISNVARGLSAIGPTRNAQAAAQYQVPMEMAGMVAKLQEAQASIGQHNAMADWYSQRPDTDIQKAQIAADAQNHRSDLRFQSAMAGHSMTAGKELQLGKGPDGKPMVMQPVYNPDINDGAGGLEYQPVPGLDPEAFAQRMAHAHASGALGNSIEGNLILNSVGPPPGAPGSPENKKWAKTAGDIYKQYRLQVPAFSAGAADSRQGASFRNQAAGVDLKNILDNNAKSSENRINAAVASTVNSGGDPLKAYEQAQQDERARTLRISQEHGMYVGMDPNEQSRYKGFGDYLSQRGYDPTTGGFASTPQTTVPQANAMGAAPQATAKPPKTALDNFMDGFRKQ